MVKYEPALVLAVDPDWVNKYRDLPKDDPRRVAYLQKWQTKVLDTANFALLAASPIWGKGISITANAATKLTPTVIRTLPWLGPKVAAIPGVAAMLAKYTIAGGAAVGLAASAVDKQIEQKYQEGWAKFENLEVKSQDKWAKEAGYTQPFNTLTDAQRAVVLTYYTKPEGGTITRWREKVSKNLEKLNEFNDQVSNWLGVHTPAQVSPVLQIGSGLILGVAEGVGYVGQFPVIAAEFEKEAIKGDAKAYALALATGMAAFFTALPGQVKARPFSQTGRLVGLFLLSPEALLKLSRFTGHTLNPTHLKNVGKAISIEWSTARIPQRGFKATTKQMIDLLSKVCKDLAEGKPISKQTIGGVEVSVRNVPQQIATGAEQQKLYHFTPDITKERGRF